MSTSDENYRLAKEDPIANLVLDYLRKQDVRTYHGNSGDMGGLALNCVSDIRMALQAEEGPAATPKTSPGLLRLSSIAQVHPDEVASLRYDAANSTIVTLKNGREVSTYGHIDTIAAMLAGKRIDCNGDPLN